MLAPYYIDSLYFGGGTPSVFGARRLCEILNTVKKNARLLKKAEITVEVNPDSVTRRGLKMLRSEGVNRLSIGVQSANDEILRLIGRRHNFAQAAKAVRLAREAGFTDVSIDLIYGLPSQSRNDWAYTLSRAMALRPDHISCYGLKLEEGTPMYTYADSALMPTEDDQADMYLYAVETLEPIRYISMRSRISAGSGHESGTSQNIGGCLNCGLGTRGPTPASTAFRYSYVVTAGLYITGAVLEQGSHHRRIRGDRLAGAGSANPSCLACGPRRASAMEEYAGSTGGLPPLETALERMGRKGWARCHTAGPVEGPPRWLSPSFCSSIQAHTVALLTPQASSGATRTLDSKS
jgi:oxygen-independent coproporphyrinogen-3 oxidase